jgi:cytochrome c oxidase assembly protein subunit 15
MVGHFNRVTKPDTAVGIWLGICCSLLALMVLLGGATRLTDSGLSIVDWRPLTGIAPPFAHSDWVMLFEKYKVTTEFQKQNFWMSLSDFKSIFWLEYLHRLLGRIIGLCFFLPFLWFTWKGKIRSNLLIQCTLVLILGGCQGYLGWFMVQSGLTERTDVSQYRLAAHFSLAIVIYMALFWMTLRCLRQRPNPQNKQFRLHLQCLISLVLITMVAGAFVAGLDAGGAYTTFPLMDGKYFPTGGLQMEPVWLNFFENTATVQFSHRQLGILVVLVSCLLWFRSLKNGTKKSAFRAITLTAGLSILQMALGIATLLNEVPIFFGIMHQAGSLCVLSSAIWALYETSSSNRSAPLKIKPQLIG